MVRDNERVNLFGEWIHGFFSIGFVGALDVGKIDLHFDKNLRTDTWVAKAPFIFDKLYSSIL